VALKVPSSFFRHALEFFPGGRRRVETSGVQHPDVVGQAQGVGVERDAIDGPVAAGDVQDGRIEDVRDAGGLEVRGQVGHDALIDEFRRLGEVGQE
jgi:hypothetical protein